MFINNSTGKIHILLVTSRVNQGQLSFFHEIAYL